MYADRVEAEGKRSVKERLNGNSLDTSTLRGQITGKRQRQDDRWEHDLYDDDEPQALNRKVGPRDLRLKLQRKSLQQSPQSGKRPLPAVRDLREKLSGIVSQQLVNSDPTKPKLEAAKVIRKNVVDRAPSSAVEKVANLDARKATSRKNDASVDSFLRSLGLEKYSITFQAEEVDMTALVHMSDEDLKALGIPMGPRKKILLELKSRA